MDRYRYLFAMGLCLVATLPLELVLGARVWRRPVRLARAIVPTLVLFLAWDLAAAERYLWVMNPAYTTGWRGPGSVPVEELAFLVVIPICGLLTYEGVGRTLWLARRLRRREGQDA